MTRDVLHAEIDIELPSLDVYSTIAQAWLTDGPAALAAPQMEAALDARLTEKSLSRHLGSFGPPGTAWGSVIIAPYSRPRHRAASLYAFTERSYARFLAKLSAEIPERAELLFYEIDTVGEPVSFYVHLDGPHIDDGRPGFVRLIAHRPGRVADDVAHRWATFTESFLASLAVPVVYGHVANDMAEETARTALEMATDGWPFEASDPLELRGYSWLTALSPGQAARLGGTDALRGSAFVQITELGSGSVLLKATERLSEYDGAAIERVWEALRPLLPAGEPLPPPALAGQPEPRLVRRGAIQP
ncbi:MAG TPA: hypothetical protein VM575_16870 [Nocardioides sp.]|nr:hypothetical protein [Nocardioides sp.]